MPNNGLGRHALSPLKLPRHSIDSMQEHGVMHASSKISGSRCCTTGLSKKRCLHVGWRLIIMLDVPAAQGQPVVCRRRSRASPASDNLV